MSHKETLIATDFDNTLLDANSDIRIKSLVHNSILPEDIDMLAKHKNGWTNYMREIFRFLHRNGVKDQDYYKCLSTMSLVPGMRELLIAAHATGKYEIIVLSDANSVFIRHCLNENGISDIIHEVFTNAASFDENGCLIIQEYHEQDVCQLCTRNLCKGIVLEEYVKKRAEEGKHFDRIVYIGDGANDVCPALKLGPEDLAFAKRGYTMSKKLNKIKNEHKEQLKAQLYEWGNGSDIQTVLFPTE